MSHTNILDIAFFAKKSRVENNYVPIYARIKFGGRDADVSIKKEIELDKWDSRSGRAKTNSETGRIFNSELDMVRTDIINCYADLKYERGLLTAESIRNRYRGDRPDEHTLLSLIAYHESHLVKNLKPGTAKNYPSTIKYLKKFIGSVHKVKDIPLTQINYPFLVDFQIFLNDYIPTDHHRKLSHNGILKHMERFKKLMNAAYKNEWISRDPFAKYEAKMTEVEVECLDERELAILESKKFDIERVARVRDIFVFCCYTGLAYCDAMSVNKNDIMIGIDGYHWIKKERQKSTVGFSVPLLPKALEIMKKYENDPKAIEAGNLFGKFSNTRMNAYLSEIADICGIKKRMTTHIARHTFGTTVTLTNKVPLETVSKMMGHRSIRTTMRYAKVIQKKVSEDMEALREKLANTSKGEKAENKFIAS